MMKHAKRVLNNQKGQIGEILVVVVLIILAVLGIVKYVMPMFDRNKDLASATSTEISKYGTQVKNSQWGNIGDEVPAQTVINTWNAIVASKGVSGGGMGTGVVSYSASVSGGTKDISPTATCGYSNDAAGTGNGSMASTQPYAQVESTLPSRIDSMGTYVVTTLTFDPADGRLTSIFYNKLR